MILLISHNLEGNHAWLLYQTMIIFSSLEGTIILLTVEKRLSFIKEARKNGLTVR